MKSAAGDRIAFHARAAQNTLTVLKVWCERITVDPFRVPPGAEASAEAFLGDVSPPDEV
jgi:transcription elongation factor GreB